MAKQGLSQRRMAVDYARYANICSAFHHKAPCLAISYLPLALGSSGQCRPPLPAFVWAQEVVELAFENYHHYRARMFVAGVIVEPSLGQTQGRGIWLQCMLAYFRVSHWRVVSGNWRERGIQVQH
jgi:hypothetical protein